MQGALVPGDWILINKSSFGARLPITPIAWPSIYHTNKVLADNYFDLLSLPYWRIPGFRKIHRSDILAFNYPLDEELPIDRRTILVKRCIGLPGDTIQLKNSDLFVNSGLIDIKTAQYEYYVKVKGKKLGNKLITKLSINEGGEISNYGEYKLYLSKNVAKDLSMEKSIAQVNHEDNLNYAGKNFFYPQDSKLGWTLNDYGPIVVPKKNLKIRLDKQNLIKYHDVIEKYEGCKLIFENDSIHINGEYSEFYTFKSNYYFFLDDNRDNGKDSRLWGFVPESHIIGKASFVICSFDPSKSGLSKIRWRRIGKFTE